MRSCMDLYFWVWKLLLSTTLEKIEYLQWMKALNNDFVPWRDQNKLKLSLLNSFGSSESSPEHLQTFLAMFRTLQKIVRNLQSHRDVSNFRIPSHDKIKISHIWLRKSRQVQNSRDTQSISPASPFSSFPKLHSLTKLQAVRGLHCACLKNGSISNVFDRGCSKISCSLYLMHCRSRNLIKCCCRCLQVSLKYYFASCILPPSYIDNNNCLLWRMSKLIK